MEAEETIATIVSIGIVIMLAILIGFSVTQQEAQKNFTQICNKLDGIVVLTPSGLECVSKNILIKK